MLSPKFAVLGVRAAVTAFMAAMFAVITGAYGKKTGKKAGKYMPHQGKQEMARRRRAMYGV